MAGWPDATDVGNWSKAQTFDNDTLDLALDAVVGWLVDRTGIAADSDAVPEAVRTACVMYISKLYRRKDSPDGVAGTNDFAGVIRTSKLDADAEKLLELYVTPTIG